MLTMSCPFTSHRSSRRSLVDIQCSPILRFLIFASCFFYVPKDDEQQGNTENKGRGRKTCGVRKKAFSFSWQFETMTAERKNSQERLFFRSAVTVQRISNDYFSTSYHYHFQHATNLLSNTPPYLLFLSPPCLLFASSFGI